MTGYHMPRTIMDAAKLFRVLLFTSGMFISANTADFANNPIKEIIQKVTIQSGTYINLTVQPEQTLKVVLSAESSPKFATFEIHSQTFNVTVSLDHQPTPGRAVSGTDIGVLSAEPDHFEWYVISREKIPVDIIALARTYDESYPMPGGCSMEFALPYDPNIHVRSNQYVTVLQFQYADVFKADQSVDFCENSTVQSWFSYEVYVSYMESGNLSILEYQRMLKTLSPDTGFPGFQKVATRKYRGKALNITLAAFPGVGAVYSVVVTRQNGYDMQQAAYVSAVSYGCNSKDELSRCQLADKIVLRVVTGILGVLGLFLCFGGHRFLKIELFLFGFLTFSLLAYIVLNITTKLYSLAFYIPVFALGVLGGALWLLLWWFIGIPVLSVLLVGLLLGYLITSIIFNLTPLGNMSWLQSSYNYGMIFACGVLIIPVLLLAFTKTLNIISCAVVGSYGVVVAVGVYVHANLIQIIVQSVYKAIIPGYQSTLIFVPFQRWDTILTAVWVGLAVFGTVVQLLTERNKPDFPPCPWEERKARRSHDSQDYSSRGSHYPINNAGEREPLLRVRHAVSAPYVEQPPPYTETADDNIRTEWGSHDQHVRVTPSS